MSHLNFKRILLVLFLFSVIFVLIFTGVSYFIKLNNLDENLYKNNYYVFFLDFNKPYEINFLLKFSLLDDTKKESLTKDNLELAKIFNKYPDILNEDEKTLLFKDLNLFYNSYPLSNYDNCYERFIDSDIFCIDNSLFRLNQFILNSYESKIEKKHISTLISHKLIKNYKQDLLQIPKINKNYLEQFFNHYPEYKDLNIIFVNYSYNKKDVYFNNINNREMMIYEFFRDTLLFNNSQNCFSFILDSNDIEFANENNFETYYPLVCQRKMRSLIVISNKLTNNHFQDYFIFAFLKTFFERNNESDIILYNQERLYDSSRIYSIIKKEFIHNYLVLNNEIITQIEE